MAAALPKSLCDREQDKFCEDSAGKTAVRVCADTDPLPVSGTFTANVAAEGPILVTGATVTATSAAFPATNQVGRASLSIRNIDLVESFYIVNAASLTKAGADPNAWEVGPNETLNLDFDDTNSVFLVADAGKTVAIQILEVKG